MYFGLNPWTVWGVRNVLVWHPSFLKESFESMVGLMVTKTNEIHVGLFSKPLYNYLEINLRKFSF